MSRPRVVVARKPPGAAFERLLAASDAWVWQEDRAVPPDLLLDRVREAEGLFTMLSDRVDEALLRAAPRLRVVSNMAVGVDNIDVAACTARGIAVGNTPEVVTEATADFAWALLLALSRRIVDGVHYVREGRWQEWSPTLVIAHDVHGKTLGIVGMGRIGLAIARRARGFGMPLLYHSRSPKPAAEREVPMAYRGLEALLAESDIVVLAVPLSAETRRLIGDAALARMKPSALLINVARGPIVDPQALCRALTEGRLRGAALDVTDPEPIAPDDPLLSLDNCLIVPHVGTSTWETRAAMCEIAVDNLLCGLRGEPLRHSVNAGALRR
ncbi:MAG: D-glycerate dehydrogenase [Candidatus Lambdaproteobacteria bacterium]|nr:D-glycerate dehydrogenase [Candidatus Lambdaproteobacteria bacterium]